MTHSTGPFCSNSNPEDRRVTPEDVNGRKKFKVVYVVLESQYQASMTVACKRINAAQVCARVLTKREKAARGILGVCAGKTGELGWLERRLHLTVRIRRGAGERVC